jgi:hypothetical protein
MGTAEAIDALKEAALATVLILPAARERPGLANGERSSDAASA